MNTPVDDTPGRESTILLSPLDLLDLPIISMGTRGPETNAPVDDTSGRESTVFLSPLDLRRSVPEVSEPNNESPVPNERDYIPGLHQEINAPRSMSFFYFYFIVPMVLQQPQVIQAGTLLLDLEGHHHHHHPSDEHHHRIIYTIY